MRKIKQIFYNFLSSELRGSLIYEDVRRATLINLFAICGIFYLIFYSHRMYILGEQKLSIIYIYCILVIILMQVYLRIKKRITIVSHVLVIGLFCLEIFFLHRNGSTRLNLTSYYIFPGIYWYYIFPPFSLFMLGRKTGTFYNIVLVGFTLLFFYSNHFNNELYDNEFKVRLLSVYSMVFLLSFFYESIRNTTFNAFDSTNKKNIRLLRMIKIKNTNLNRSNRELSQLSEEISTQMEYLKILNTELVGQNEKIANQNNKLESQGKEILEQRDLLMQYKQNIDDSIIYASYIQQALLPGDDVLSENFHDHFILYQPRNIIGGDFYFIKKIDDQVIIAAADCTGHGVPGALLSMLGIAALSEIVFRKEIYSTSMILTDMKREVMSVLKRKDNLYDAKDGMDISLCKIDLRTFELQFSGAYNPIFIIRNSEIIHLRGDKVLVGNSFIDNGIFTNQDLKLEKNDCIYLFSDGYSDQLGGLSRKKFLMRNFQELLIKISCEPMSTQKSILLHNFEAWKGSNDQTDDVMVLGIRV